MTSYTSEDDNTESRLAQRHHGASRTSSPASTGGAGTTFEQHVGAYWLAQLLVGAIPPILTDSTVSEVSFQTARLGWHTDDCLVTCSRGSNVRRIASQVKRSFTVSASNSESVQTIASFWRDFNGPCFSRDDDRLALVTLRGSNNLLEHFVGLLDCARAAQDGADFKQRLATEGFVSKKAVGYCDELREIIGNVEGRTVPAVEVWPFLRALHVLSLDLHSSTAQTEAHIKSMLALTTKDGDPVARAAASWNQLVVAASAGMSAGRSLRRDDLPAATLAPHGIIGTNERRVLQALRDHTDPVLRAIRATLGRELHLPRAALVQKLIEALENTQVVLVTGPAGSGKSAIGKAAVDVLATDHFLFGFRVEEFAQSHFDATLAAAQVAANWKTLRAILAAQDRKIVLVESVERLLEKTTRDAFTDLITLAADDPGVRIVLTCRDYSVEQVRASFLRHHDISCTIVPVPPLDDFELAQAEAAYPVLGVPLKSPALRNVLRNPFVLDKALNIQWSSAKSLPQSEREFRALFWRDIVRAGDRVPLAMGRPREAVLQTIAVRRARALSSHIPTTDLDAGVVDSLRSDSLLTSPADNPFLVATAHDVLEDWAILQWLEEQHLSRGSVKALADAIGTHPAVRRSYRKWVAELIDRDPVGVDRLFRAATTETQISVQFRDDTLVSLLKAPSAAEFLARHQSQLLANDRAILKRVIHLLRVACVKSPDWLTSPGAQGSVLSVPDGSAWPAVLEIVRRNLAAITHNERGLIIGLVEDAVRGVSWWAPDLEGAEDVASIAYWLLDGMRDYGSHESRKRVLKVLAKIPKADAARFESTLRGQLEDEGHRDVVAKDFQELIYADTSGMAAARDLPETVISIAADYLLATEEDIGAQQRHALSTLDIALYFGIKEGLENQSFPASAMRGPWLHLLRYHPNKALDFYVKVFNHTADWYAHPRLLGRLEKAWKVELTFADGAQREQWANDRLWALYRGMTVGPYPLQSMLMALEKWLLELGKNEPEVLDGTLVDILRRSDNAALAGVTAGVAEAYPNAAGEALLVLLSVPDYVLLDRHRFASEQMQAASGLLPMLRVDHQFYDTERKEADSLPHRQRDLEAAILNLQLGPLAERVQAQIDRHLAALPPKDQQAEDDLLWRLAIHRMDLRQYNASDVPGPESIDEHANPSVQRYIRLDPKPPETDLQNMVAEGASELAATSARVAVRMWGIRAFRRETDRYEASQWAAKLAEAQSMASEVEQDDGSSHAPGFVAAVCIRDHWDEMTRTQGEWCVDTACAEVLQHADDRADRWGNNPMAADRACASALATLLGKTLDATRSDLVKAAFVAALTHSVDEVRWYATWSIDENLWATNRALALRCLNAIATEAAITDELQSGEKYRPRGERRDLRKIMGEAAGNVRDRFWIPGAIDDDAHTSLDISTRFGVEALKRMLAILGRVPQDPLAVDAFTLASRTLAGWWTSKDDHPGEMKRSHDSEASVSKRIQEFLLRTSPDAAQKVLAPLLGAIDRHSRELQSLMEGLTHLQDATPNTSQYWFLWELIADSVKRAPWVARLNKARRAEGADLLAAVFLTLDWKDNVRHWRSLEGYAHLVHALFEALPATSVVLDNYARFLYHIGERSLPDAFAPIAGALQRGTAEEMLSTSNTVFMLEVLLQRYVYGRPLELKRDERIRNAVLAILDALIDVGSSAAFRMRDDFVTPAA